MECGSHSNHDEEEDQDGNSDKPQETEISFEVENTCNARCKERLRNFMIYPDNKRLKIFKIVFVLCFYTDIILTSLLLSRYDFKTGYDDTARLYMSWLTGISIFQGLDIIINFLTIIQIDIQKIDDPYQIFIHYLKDMFIIDVIASYPYWMYWPGRDYLLLRLIRMRRYKEFRTQVSQFIQDQTSDSIDNQQLKKMIEFFNLTLMLVLSAHFFACIWIHIGLYEWHILQTGWIVK